MKKNTLIIVMFLFVSQCFSQTAKIWDYKTEKYIYPKSWSGKSLNGFADGYGTCYFYTNSDNSYYTGQISNGKMNGYGKMRLFFTYKGNNNIFIDYEGYWSNGLPNGPGYISDHVGGTFAGDFKYGKLYQKIVVSEAGSNNSITLYCEGLDLIRMFTKIFQGYEPTSSDFPCSQNNSNFVNTLKTIFGVTLAAYIISDGFEEWGVFQRQVISCAVQYGINDIVNNSTNAVLLSEAVASVIEKRRYSIKNVSQSIATEYVIQELKNNGHTQLANNLQSGSFIYCLLSSLW